jgi:hypothetical protein
MVRWRLEDGEKTIAEIEDIKELEDIIDKIRTNNKGKNIIYILSHPNRQFMQIGISDKIGFLNFHDSSDEPPYYSSVAEDTTNIADKIMDFYICGNYTEIPLRNCIPFKELLDTIKEFFRTGKLPNTIKWEED